VFMICRWRYSVGQEQAEIASQPIKDATAECALERVKKLRHNCAADQISVKKVLDTERMFCYTHVSPIFRTYVPI